jgi:hypothetical protein
MVNQFKASNKGFTENKVDGKGKIKLAKYFVYIEVYDFSVGEDEVVETSGVTIKQNTQLGLQVRFVDAESGAVITGSDKERRSQQKHHQLLVILMDQNSISLLLVYQPKKRWKLLP